MADDSYSTLKSLDALSPRGLAGKREYVLELERRADPGALLQLVECLNDESGYLRDLAGAALARLRAPVGPIVPLLASGLWYARVSALRTLARLGDAACAAPVCPLLEDSNQSVRADALATLLALARTADEVRVARALHALPDALRSVALRDFMLRAPDTARRLQALLADRDLMQAEEHELLPRTKDARTEDGVAWDVLTSAAPGTAAPAGGASGRPR
jgi:HEAT repeat protein